MQHWQSKDAISMTAVQHLSRQMWEAVAFLRSMSFVHRDVKADNFMMEMPELENPANNIYLGDFGTVIQLHDGDRLTQRCGTRNYWSPELYGGNYAHKVDCWAVGVATFGLISGHFPFESEKDATLERLEIDSRVSAEGQELIRWALQPDEAMRCEAAEAFAHPFNTSNVHRTASGRPEPLPQPESKDLEASSGQAPSCGTIPNYTA